MGKTGSQNGKEDRGPGSLLEAMGDNEPHTAKPFPWEQKQGTPG